LMSASKTRLLAMRMSKNFAEASAATRRGRQGPPPIAVQRGWR
jgi:hypothetical protein